MSTKLSKRFFGENTKQQYQKWLFHSHLPRKRDRKRIHNGIAP